MENIFIISGAAGSGKDSVIAGLQAFLPIERVVTTTARPMRPFEKEGDPYYFVSREIFERGIAAGEFIEHSVNENGGLYGVTKKELERSSHIPGKIALLRVDWKGVVSIKKLFPTIPTILISAPLAVLEARLRKRDADKDEHYFQERMDYTREWMKHLDIYDYQVENEDGKLDEAIAAVKSIIEKHRST